mmetsp:Transcript_31523/g.84127  ORF Transcript_31523/g.84127 Transcript_31523/m.84127 type:complete len:93 (-) Transcript_31523:9-287(-)
MTRMESGWRRVAVLTLFHRGTHRLVMIETRVEAAGSLVDLYDVVSVRVWLRCTHLAETQKKTVWRCARVTSLGTISVSGVLEVSEIVPKKRN